MGQKFSQKKKKSSRRQEERDKAILALKVSRDRLMKYQDRLESDNTQSITLAKQLLKEGRRSRALMVMKLKKLRERYILTASGTLYTVEQQIAQAEQAELNASVYDNLKQSNAVLKKLMAMMPMDEVERIVEETREMTSEIQEISSLISSDLQPADSMAAEEEYDRLIRETRPKQTMESPAIQKPIVKPVQTRTETEREAIAM